ncbi:hypothetical protein HKCCA1065_11655 [Rhodobacterales bacterium HKCCA1065]|nr:hypothetical protein [Rhodobacterales bacterium HKCCA1065]
MGGVILSDGFHAKGRVSLAGAEIGGQLSCTGGRFENPEGDALNAQNVRVKSNVFLSDKFHATGAVSLAGAEIGGQLSCEGGQFENPKGLALNAQGARVAGSMFLRHDFQAAGAVRISGAEIGGQLDCSGGRFEAPKDKGPDEINHAINAQGARIREDVFLSNKFHATGEVSFAGAEIGGQLSCVNGTFEKAKRVALNAQHLTCKGALVFRDVTVPEGYIDFSAGHVGALRDRVEDWPKGGRVILDGFTYDRIIAAATTGKSRLNWLSRVDRGKRGGFKPQPYTQLAKVLRNMGHERGARDVLVARDRKIAAAEWTRARPKYGWSGDPWTLLKAVLSRAVACASYLLIDYGHRPLKALWSLIALWLIATMLAHFAWKAGDMVPNSDVILTSENWAAIHDATNPASSWEATPEGQSWESFCSFFWGLDLVVPILDLGQTQAWTPSTNLGFAGQFLWGAKSILTILGWIVLAFAAAGVTGVARRD